MVVVFFFWGGGKQKVSFFSRSFGLLFSSDSLSLSLSNSLPLSSLTSERRRVAVLARDRLPGRLAVVHRPRELGPHQRRLGHDALDGDEAAEQRRREVARADARRAEVAGEAEAEAGARVGREGLGVVGAGDLVEGLRRESERGRERGGG